MAVSGVPSVTYGRSAWTIRGKSNASNLYKYVASYPLDGQYPTEDVNFQAVSLGVRAIQNRLKTMGFAPNLTVTGAFDASTAAAVRAAQDYFGFTVTGSVNSTLSGLLWRGVIEERAARYGVKPKYLWGMMQKESTADPGAVGYYNPPDSGLVQINVEAHDSITVYQAYDPNFAFDYAASRLKANFVKYAAKGATLQEACSIAQWNSPASADKWYATGVASNTTIQAYVTNSLKYAATYVPTPANMPAPAPVPTPMPPTPVRKTYTVVAGDTLSGIGSKVGVAWQTIASLNGLVSPYVLRIGQVLYLN